MGGPRRRKAPTKQMWATVEQGYYDDVGRMMESEKRWKDEAAFVRDAIIEKVNRWRAGHTSPPGPSYEEATDPAPAARKARR